MTAPPAVPEVARLMRETAELLVMPRFGTLGADEVMAKTGPKDLVTIADTEAEWRLTPLLQDLLPGSAVIGEEAAAADPDIFHHFAAAEPVWVLDPVDGTGNFAKAGRYFCMMVALVVGGEIVLGVILDPLGQAWVGAERGAGAWSYAYDDGAPERLAVLAPCPTGEMLGALNFRYLESPLKEDMRARCGDVVGHHYRLGCAGHEYLRMVTGEAHFALHAKTMPWDHAAGCLIHREAGGYQARFDGSAYRPGHRTGGILSAPDKGSWQRLRAGLFGAVVETC